MRAPLRCWALLPIVSRGLCHRWSIIFSSADIRVSWIRQSIRPSITLIRKGSPVNHEKQSPLPKSLTSYRKFLRHLFLLECSNFAETVDRLRSSLNPAKLLFNQRQSIYAMKTFSKDRQLKIPFDEKVGSTHAKWKEERFDKSWNNTVDKRRRWVPLLFSVLETRGESSKEAMKASSLSSETSLLPFWIQEVEKRESRWGCQSWLGEYAMNSELGFFSYSGELKNLSCLFR